jgi:hypothetical protein
VTPGRASDRNIAENIVYTVDCPKVKRASPEIKRGSSDLRCGPYDHSKKLEKPESDGFSKMFFSILVDRPGCTAGPSVTALSDNLTKH